MRKPKNRPITMDEIARLAKVSKPTVSRALSNSPLVTEETRQRVLDVARAQGYAINRNAQKLRTVRANSIAVVLDFRSHRDQRIADPFMYELLAGVSEALSMRNLDLLLSPPSLSDALSYADLVASRGVDGFIFLGQGLREPVLSDLARRDVPFVVWGAVSKRAPYCTVGSDNHLGGRLAADHLLKRAPRRILFAGAIHHTEIALRREGLLSRIREADDTIEIIDLAVDAFSYNSSYLAAESYLADHDCPDGVFAFSDTAAMAFVSAFRAAGFEAAQDYSIVGYNDIPPSAHFLPPLTTIRQDTQHAGALLVEKLMQAIEGGKPVSTMLPTELTVRAS